MVTSLRTGALALAIAAAIGCRATADADIGLGAQLRVEAAQFVGRRYRPAAPGDGPAVVSVFNSLTAVQPGEREKPLTGTLAASATTVALGLRGNPATGSSSPGRHRWTRPTCRRSWRRCRSRRHCRSGR